MTTTHRALALILAPLTLSIGTAAMANRSSDDLRCELRTSATPAGLKLEAVATAGAHLSGEYELMISKSGAAGSSNVTQGGEFEVRPGEPALLGEVTLGSDEGASVEAVLTVRSADGGIACESRYPQST